MLGPQFFDHILELVGDGDQPVAVAFSGGGDSTALLSLVTKVFKEQGRSVYALIVDHDLRKGTVVEAKLAAKRAREMGAKTEILKWQHDKLTTGIQEKARNARYQLLGDACRRLGITKLFLGHNRDDQAETVWMRKTKGSGWRGLAGMQETVMAPIWPALRGIEIIRPLLAYSRADILRFNLSCDLVFISDPSNENLAFDRIKTRKHLAKNTCVTEEMLKIATHTKKRLSAEKQTVSEFAIRNCTFHDWGGVMLDRAYATVREISMTALLRYLIPAINGQNGFPSEPKVEKLAHRLKGSHFTGATLSGTRFVALDDKIIMVRDPGMVLGRGGKPPIKPVPIRPNTPAVWDGRFEVTVGRPECAVVPLGVCWNELDADEKQNFKHIPHQGRLTYPAVVSGSGHVLLRPQKVETAALASERLNCLLGPTIGSKN